MTYSYFKYTGDGKTNTFAIPFILGYFKAEDISVRVGDEVDGAGQPKYRTWSFLPGNTGMIQIDGNVPAVGEEVVIKRTVSKTTLVHDFQKGEPLDELSLDESHEQLMMAIHELMDGRNITFLEGLNVFGDINMNDYHIRNLTTDKEDPTSAVSYSVIEELETKMDEAADNVGRAEAAVDKVNQAMSNLYSMSTAPFVTEDGVLEYDLGEDIVLNMDANNLLFSLGGVVQQPYVDYELVTPNRIRLKENPGDGLEGWGITCLSFSAPDLSKFLQEIRAAAAKVEEDRQHVDSVAEDIQNVKATAVTVQPGQDADATWDSETNTITIYVPRGEPGDLAIATSTSPGAVIPKTGDEDGMSLDEDGSIRVRHSTATQWGTVLSSEVAAADTVPRATSSGVLDDSWLSSALNAAAVAQETADTAQATADAALTKAEQIVMDSGIVTLRSTRTNGGTWTITGLTVGKPLYILASSTVRSYAFLYVTSGADAGKSGASANETFFVGCGQGEYSTNAFITVPTSSTVVIQFGKMSLTLRAYQ